ncbi:MAG TPA: FtsX-like permease family protein [Pyrinomonadaceae bacterium]|nr:FtsX-like permease family protein [Pyrinomonadaceae bacterium]
MRISSIAWANLKRRKGKAAFLVAGISIGIATVVALLTLSRLIKDEIGTQLDQFGANIIVVPQSNSLSLDYGGVSVSGVSLDAKQLKNGDAQRILEIPYRNRISVVAPKILDLADVDGQQALLAGVDFASELKLKRWWRLVGHTPQERQDLLVGYDAAKSLSLIEDTTDASSLPISVVDSSVTVYTDSGKHQHNVEQKGFRIIQDSLTIAGQEHRVAGVIAPTGGTEDRMIFGSLDHFQSLLEKPDQLSMIEVSALCIGCPVEDIVKQISAQLPNAKVSALEQSVRARADTVDRVTRFAIAVSAVVLVIGALMIFTTMMGSVVERTKEIGVLRAIGLRKLQIIKELMIEVAAISTIGGLLGWIVGMLASWLILPYFSESGLTLEFDPKIAPGAVVAALVIGALSTIYPAIRASRLDPSEAVRYV